MITKEGLKRAIKDTKDNLSYIILEELFKMLCEKEGK